MAPREPKKPELRSKLRLLISHDAGDGGTPRAHGSNRFRSFLAAASLRPHGRDGTRAHIATCAECGCLSSLYWAGWGAYRANDPEDASDPSALAFYCPACARREFERRGG